MQPRLTTLYFAPTQQYVEAQILPLTPDLAVRRIRHDWWTDDDLREQFFPLPIDRNWNWNEMEIEYEGTPLQMEKIAILTGDGAVQGAMMISTEPVHSILTAGAGALFLELLFTAPRNRPALRRDGKPYFLGVGTELLAFGASLSRELGYDGRLLLDGSPEYVEWYERRGLQKLQTKPILFEGVEYTPMELSADAAQRMLKDFEY